MAYIDENTKNVGLAYQPDSTEDTAPLSCEPTYELRIEIIPIATVGTIISPQNLIPDENTHQIAGAVTDDSSENITPLTVDLIGGFACLRVEDPDLP